jgi:GT2 family glycosyltransferase
MDPYMGTHIEYDVSVVIVNYNTFQLTSNCINSILNTTLDVSYEIILVDNNSSDGSVEKLKIEFPEIKIISNSENIGFGRANNIGVSKANGKFVFLLNSDTILHNNALKIFLDFFKENSNSKIGVVGSLLLNEDGSVGKSSSNLPTVFSVLLGSCKGLLYRFFLSRNSGFKQNVEFDRNNCIQVGQILGADMFMLRTTYDEVNGFDPRFFMYFEETDMQKRLSKIGFSNFLIKGPKITHLEGRSSGSIRKYKMYYRSMWLYFKKHLL